jgi:hypothetical protein
VPFRFLSRHRPIQAYVFFCCLDIEPEFDDVAIRCEAPRERLCGSAPASKVDG